MRKCLLVLGLLSNLYVNAQNDKLGTKIENVVRPSDLPDSIDGEPVSIHKIYPELNIFIAVKGDFTNKRCAILEVSSHKKLTPFIFADIDGFYNKSTLSEVLLNSKYGIINTSGQLVIPCVYDMIHPFNINNVNYYIVSKNERYGIINDKNETVIPFEYDRISERNGGSLLWVTRYDKHGFMQFPSRKMLIPAIYDGMELLSPGALLVRKGTLYTILKGNGEKLLLNWYSSLEIKRGENFAVAELHGRKGLIDATEKAIIPLEYEVLKRIDRYSGVLYIAARDGRYGIIGGNGKIVTPLEYDMITMSGGGDFLIASKNNKYGLLKLDGTAFLPFEYGEIVDNNSFFVVKKENKYGVLNQSGELVLPVEYDLLNLAFCMDQYNRRQPYLLGAKNGKKGIIYINSWNSPLGFIYDDLISTGKGDFSLRSGDLFYNSVIAVKNGKYGVIEMNGQEVLPFVYDDMQYVSEFLVIARKNNKYGVVDIHNNNNVVLPFEYQFINCKDYKLVAYKKEYEKYLAIGNSVSKTDN
jgi:hypothetical protein